MYYTKNIQRCQPSKHPYYRGTVEVQDETERVAPRKGSRTMKRHTCHRIIASSHRVACRTQNEELFTLALRAAVTLGAGHRARHAPPRPPTLFCWGSLYCNVPQRVRVIPLLPSTQYCRSKFRFTRCCLGDGGKSTAWLAWHDTLTLTHTHTHTHTHIVTFDFQEGLLRRLLRRSCLEKRYVFTPATTDVS